MWTTDTYSGNLVSFSVYSGQNKNFNLIEIAKSFLFLRLRGFEGERLWDFHGGF